MGHRLLHQSNTSGRIGAVLARSKDSHGRGEKVGVYASTVAGGCPKSSSKFAILRDSARYPSGPRERSAKPPFVGSNPTRASKHVVYAVFREPPGPLRREKGRSRRPSPFIKSIFLAEFLSLGLLLLPAPAKRLVKL